VGGTYRPWYGKSMVIDGLFVARISFLGFERQCELKQAPDSFRPRWLVMLLPGPAFNCGPKRRREPQRQHGILSSRRASSFFS
jgi:hypothetical protein